MVDLHCHILPGLDDGADSIGTMLGMAHMAAAAGTDRVICTPHCSTDDPDLAARFARIREIQTAASALLRHRKIPVALLPGMELLCGEGLEDCLQMPGLLTLNGSRYLLIEFDFSLPFPYIEEAAQAVFSAGMIPVIAHPERYIAIQRRPLECIEPLFMQGCVIQVNKGSVLGRFGPAPERTADRILSHGLAHVVASDAHGTQMRTPVLDEVRRVISARYSPVYAEVLLLRNPQRILQNRPLVTPEEG